MATAALSANMKSLLLIVLFVFVFIPAALLIFPALRPSDGFENQPRPADLKTAFDNAIPGVYVPSEYSVQLSKCGTCPEGTFCEQTSNSCVSVKAPYLNEPVGYYS